MAVIALAAVHILVLAALGRAWSGDCAGLWQTELRAGCNSSHALDPYSLLHLGFGLGLGAFFATIRPHWRTRDMMLLVVFASTVWELVENLPPVIAMFGYHDRPELAYDGDSILNSLGDTVATTLGGMLASALSRSAALCTIVLIEVGTTLSIGDGYLVGVTRLFGG